MRSTSSITRAGSPPPCRSLAVLFAAVSLALAAAPATARGPQILGVSFAPDTASVAFSRGDFGDMNVYVVDVRSGELRQITDDGISMLEPFAWSPGGARLLMLHGTWPTMDIHVRRFDRDRTSTLTASEGIEHMARWAPDGQHVAFASNREVNMQVYVISTTDGEVRRLTEDPAGSAAPSWSPDGSRIAFHSSRDGNQDIYVVTVDGKVTRLTKSKDDDMEPQWSPTGDRIAFVRGSGGNRAVYVMNADGSGERVMSQHPSADPQPRWSPDGSRLVYAGAADLHVVDIASGTLHTITAYASVDDQAAWSPDGASIALVATVDDAAELYLARPDGMTLQRITRFTEAPDLEPVIAATARSGPAPETTAESAQKHTPPAEPPAGTETAGTTTPAQSTPEKTADVTPETNQKKSAEKAPEAPPPAATTSPEKLPEEKRPTPSESQPVRPAVAAAGVAAAGTDLTTETIPRAAVTSDVVEREPVDVLTQVSSDTEKVYFFTQIMNMTGKTVTHRWIYGDSVMAEVNFDVRGGHWRVYSTKRLLRTWTGPWLVQALGPDGAVLAARRFEVVAP